MSDSASTWTDLPPARGGPKTDVTSRSLLSKLAAVSNDDDWAWMTVPMMAERVGCSERTIQSRLRLLIKAGLLRDTGETYRKGTRSVPYYELMVDYGAVAAEHERRRGRRLEKAEIGGGKRPSKGSKPGRSMGAAVCTHSEDAGDAVCTRMGATVCTPYEAIGGEGSSDELPTRGREVDKTGFGERLDVGFAEALAAYPATGRKVTSIPAARAAWPDAVAEAGGIGRLLAAVRAYAADPDLKRREGGAPSLHRWLAEKRWLNWLSAASVQGLGVVEAVRSGWAGPAPVWAEACRVKGEDFAVSYLAGAAWDAERGAVVARTGVAAEALVKGLGRQALAAAGVVVVEGGTFSAVLGRARA